MSKKYYGFVECIKSLIGLRSGVVELKSGENMTIIWGAPRAVVRQQS